MKEGEKINKHLNFAGELKKLWSMKITVILISVCVLGMLLKGLERIIEKLDIK